MKTTVGDGVQAASNLTTTQVSWAGVWVYICGSRQVAASSADPHNGNMKLTIFVCLVALAAAVPDKDATILLDERSDQGDGNFRYEFETSNGIYTQKTGTPGSEGQSNHQGAFR
ncbi:Cuticle protein AMP1B-like 1 [Homarus americanus]|uniref:Cuticle protein AMP1B-like 1 n=1 Tax=Homarus americanus TaxID=6706 RepID=A0A8J5NCT1_HOMAM|nr:Cuticle protein AMP1B-like 1 [Homarus americanus]